MRLSPCTLRLEKFIDNKSLDMKIRQLESALSSIKGAFDCPKVALEQYPTSAHLAANIVHAAAALGDIEGCNILDLGVGTGMLTIASIMMGSLLNVGVDVDEDALALAQANLRDMDLFEDVDLVLSDVQDVNLQMHFDTVIMNPPFGTRNTGIDTVFVEKGMAHADVVYSLHKSSTRTHFLKLAEEREWELQVVAELNYDLPKTMRHHKDKSRDISVDLLRFAHGDSS